jgi:hypothetical protein
LEWEKKVDWIFDCHNFTIKDGKTITLVPLSPKQVYNDQMELKTDCEDGESEN